MKEAKNKMKKILNKRGAMALSQIFILLFGIIAMGYALGSEIKIVSGDEPDCQNNCKLIGYKVGRGDVGNTKYNQGAIAKSVGECVNLASPFEDGTYAPDSCCCWDAIKTDTSEGNINQDVSECLTVCSRDGYLNSEIGLNRETCSQKDNGDFREGLSGHESCCCFNLKNGESSSQTTECENCHLKIADQNPGTTDAPPTNTNGPIIGLAGGYALNYLKNEGDSLLKKKIRENFPVLGKDPSDKTTDLSVIGTKNLPEFQWPEGLSFDGKVYESIGLADGKTIDALKSSGKIGEDYFDFARAKDGSIYQFKNGNWELVKHGQGQSSWLSEQFGLTSGGYMDAIVSGAQWAVLVYAGIKMFGGMLGFDKSTTDALSTAAAWGVFTGKSLGTLLGENGALSSSANGWNKFFTFGGKVQASTASYIWGAAVAAIIFFSMYKKESTKIVSFTCNTWDAPIGGEKCEECNKQGVLTCSEYQCRSLGQSCQLLNQGTAEEKCAWVNRQDVSPPEIKPLNDALLADYTYSPDNAVSPPDRGVKIMNSKSTTGCAKAFTPISFGISTNEPAKCKLDYVKKQNFSNMQFYFGGSSLFSYNHTQIMSLPGPTALKSENLTMENNGEFEAFVKCQDSNGNENVANFVFKYCVEKGPDTTPPIIVSTNVLNSMPVSFNQSSLNLEVYTNEPADCKWSHRDQNYEKMEEGMICSSSIFEMNAQMLYKCTTTLTGLEDQKENKFYFRCKDNPLSTENERNANTESYEFKLIGTQPLVISSIKPNGTTIKGSSDSIKVSIEVETSAGYKEGESTCYYSETESEDSYIMFLETESYKHNQELWLPTGAYSYYIKCVDLGGNSDKKKINFNVESDTSSPPIARIYHEESYLKVITTEKAKCVYDVKDCNYLFKDGIAINNLGGITHYLNWNTKTNIYIKCQDDFGNEPSPSECSVIARPTEIFNKEKK